MLAGCAMMTGRERVDAFGDAIASDGDDMFELASAIASDLDRLEGMRRGLNELVVAGVISA